MTKKFMFLMMLWAVQGAFGQIVALDAGGGGGGGGCGLSRNSDYPGGYASSTSGDQCAFVSPESNLLAIHFRDFLASGSQVEFWNQRLHPGFFVHLDSFGPPPGVIAPYEHTIIFNAPDVVRLQGAKEVLDVSNRVSGFWSLGKSGSKNHGIEAGQNVSKRSWA